MRKSLTLSAICLLVSVAVAQADSASAERQYLENLGQSTSYDAVREMRAEILARKDLTMDEKKAITANLTAAYQGNLDKAKNAAVAELWTRGVVSMALQTAGGVIPGPVGGAIDAWGRGVLDGKSAEEIGVDMAVGAAVSGITPVALKKGGQLAVVFMKKTKAGTFVVDKAVSLTEKATSKTLNSDMGNFVFRNLGKTQKETYDVLTAETKALKKQYGDLLRKPNKSLSQADLKTKNEVLERIRTNTDAARLVKSGPTDAQITESNFKKVMSSLAERAAMEPVNKYLNPKLQKNVYEQYAKAKDSLRGDAEEDRLLLEGAVSMDVTANGDTIPTTDNILNGAFYETIGAVQNPLIIANDAFGMAVKKILAGNEDKTLGEQIGDFVKGKIDESIQKGKDWIEQGGIRDTIKKQLEKQLDGKVSEEDKQHILNLADTLCNVNQDGGESFVKALGTDGKELATSLAVNELKKQVSEALPKDVADNVNAMLDSIKATGDITDPAVRQKMVESVQAAVKEYVPYSNSADAINKLIGDIADGNGVDVIGTAKDLGKSIAADGLKEIVSKNLDKEAAEKVNALIDAYAANGTKGLTEAAVKEINAAIDKYAPGKDSADALKNVVGKISDGTVTAGDLKNAGTSVVADAAKNLIDKSGLSDDAKRAAKEAVDELAKNGLTGLSNTAQKYIEQYVTDKLGEDAGNAVGAIFDAITTPGADVWDAIEKNAPVIGQAVCSKVLAQVEKIAVDQLNKLIDKYPGIKKAFDFLGIDGASIVAGVKNIWGVLQSASNIKEALSGIAKLAVQALKDIAVKIIDWAVGKVIGFVNNLIDKAVDWIIGKLGKWSANANGIWKQGLEKLKQQAVACKKCGTLHIKASGVGQHVLKWVEGATKKKQTGTTVYQGTIKK